jgi:uncharacterized protein YbjQ (UPF0145 family)
MSRETTVEASSPAPRLLPALARLEGNHSCRSTTVALIVTTTPTIEGRAIVEYHGIVAGEVILGVNVFKDIAAGFRNIVGGRSGKYEEELRKGRDGAVTEMGEHAAQMGADAVVGVKIDYETVGGQMLMITASGTAVKLA